MRRIYAAPGRGLPAEATATQLYGHDRLAHPDGRAQVELCMIATVDGTTYVDGRSGPLGGPADRQVLAALRSAASWVLVGAETARVEAYNKPKRDDLRVGVVTRSGALDLTSSLFTSGAGVAVMPEDGPTIDAPTIRAGTGGVDFRRAIEIMGGTFIHVEGGAHINAQLLRDDLVDALNITFSPALGGGAGESITAAFSANGQYAALSLAHVYEDEGFVFARYERVPD